MTRVQERSEEHTSELQSRVDISYAVFCLKKKRHSAADGIDGMASGATTWGRRLPCALSARGAEQRGVKVEPGLAESSFCLFFNDTATTEIYTLSLHDALPIWRNGEIENMVWGYAQFMVEFVIP